MDQVHKVLALQLQTLIGGTIALLGCRPLLDSLVPFDEKSEFTVELTSAAEEAMQAIVQYATVCIQSVPITDAQARNPLANLDMSLRRDALHTKLVDRMKNVFAKEQQFVKQCRLRLNRVTPSDLDEEKLSLYNSLNVFLVKQELSFATPETPEQNEEKQREKEKEEEKQNNTNKLFELLMSTGNARQKSTSSGEETRENVNDAEKKNDNDNDNDDERDKEIKVKFVYALLSALQNAKDTQ